MLDGEKEFLIRAIGGEASAFGLLYKHYQPQIYRFIYFKVGLREEAEDLPHQVFLNAWNNIEGYQFQGFPFSSWLYRIARNQVVDHYRAAKPNTSSLDNVDTEIAAPLDDPIAAIEDKNNLTKIKMAISRLKPEYQEIIIMRFVEDMAVKEVASAMGKSEGAIKILQHRAVKSLKKLINGSR